MQNSYNSVLFSHAHHVMLNSFQHLTASLCFPLPRTDPELNSRWLRMWVLFLQRHAELVSASHREPLFSFTSDRSWNKFRMTSYASSILSTSCWTRFSISPRAITNPVLGEILKQVIRLRSSKTSFIFWMRYGQDDIMCGFEWYWDGSYRCFAVRIEG